MKFESALAMRSQNLTAAESTRSAAKGAESYIGFVALIVFSFLSTWVSRQMEDSTLWGPTPVDPEDLGCLEDCRMDPDGPDSPTHAHDLDIVLAALLKGLL